MIARIEGGSRRDRVRAWWPSGFALLVGAAAATGFVIRIVFVNTYASAIPLNGDTSYYFFQARGLVDGKGFVDPLLSGAVGHLVPGAAHPPGFSVFLALVRLLGFPSASSARYACCLLGTATVVLVGLTARRAIGARAGVIAAFIAATYPNIWINDGVLMSETLYVFGFTLALWGAFGYWRQSAWRPLLVTVVGLTIAASARPEAVLLLPLIMPPLILARRQLAIATRLRMLGIAVLVPLLVLGSWTVYNLGRFEHPVLLSTQFGGTIRLANCGVTYYGPLIGSSQYACRPPPAKPIPDESKFDAEQRRMTFDYIGRHLDRVPKVVAARELRLWDVFHPEQQLSVDHYVWSRGSVNLLVWSRRAYWLLVGLAIVGSVVWRRRRIMMYPLLAQVGVTSFAAGITAPLTRFRAATEVCIVLLAACAIDAAIVALQKRRSSREPPHAAQGTRPVD